MSINYFEAKLMASQENKALIQNVQLQNGSGTAVIAKPGYHFVIDPADDVDDTIYTARLGATDVNQSALVGIAPAANTAKNVFVADPVEVQTLTDAEGREYRVGGITYGLSAAAGKIIRGRKLEMYDRYYVGESDFASAPTVGQYGLLTGSAAFTLTPSATIDTAKFCVRIVKKHTITAGSEGAFDCYELLVVSLA